MILDFGYICIDVGLNTGNADLHAKTVTAHGMELSPGGRGLNQALAAARMGAKVSMIGAIGEDLFGKDIITRMQREGIATTGIARTKTPTGMVTRIQNSQAGCIEVLSPSANTMAKANQIPLNALNPRVILLLQDDMADAENLVLMARAQDGGARTVLNVKSQEKLDALGMAANFIVMGEEFKLPQDLKGVVIFNLKSAARALMSDGGQWTMDTPYPGQNFDDGFAEDCFCGCLAACLQAGCDLPTALSYARMMSILAGGKETREKFPYLDEVEAAFKEFQNSRSVA